MKTFEVIDEKTKETKKYRIGNPTPVDFVEANKRKMREINAAIEAGCYFDNQVYDKAIEAGIWSEEKELKLGGLILELNSLINKLELGGYELNDAIEDAKKAGSLRDEIFKMRMTVNQLSSYTVERHGENAESDYLLYSTLQDSSGNKVFNTYEQFLLAKQNNSDIIRAAMYSNNNIDFSFFDELPENKFLKEYSEQEQQEQQEQKKAKLESKKEEPKPFLKDGKPIVKKKEKE